MTGRDMTPLRDSGRMGLPQARPLGAVDESQNIDLTLTLRRRAEIPRDLVEGAATVSRYELAERYGADPADVDLVRRTAQQHGLEVTESPHARQVKVSGPLARIREVVDPGQVQLVESPDPVTGGRAEHRQREGELRILPEWDGVVVGVQGLDDRPQARPHLRRMEPRAANTSYAPPDLAKVYRFPQGTDGTGQTMAIVELGGGFTTQELARYFDEMGVSPAPVVHAKGVDGSRNAPQGDPSGDDGEVLLDIEVAGALAPGARQVVYFAPNTDQGFVDAVTTAISTDPPPAAVSISWGLAENRWSPQGRRLLDEAFADAAALGVTVCVASGDNGSTDKERDGRPHADFPASGAHALACGGTRLQADPRDGTVASETVWHSREGITGGGVSRAFDLPDWQSRAGVPNGSGRGRGVPDVSAVADPNTGYQVLVDGESQVTGGTSAVAPLWAALSCRLAEALGWPLGLLQPLLPPRPTDTAWSEPTADEEGACSALTCSACPGS
ncbi:S53 family peptidase, partial [Streptomyces sp. NPDC049577]|uniref:S53 family peptidase n=1 Tax=Streptomyces sp. NPDC049577 TaxID=3155153 RepID=UPI00344AFEED